MSGQDTLIERLRAHSCGCGGPGGQQTPSYIAEAAAEIDSLRSRCETLEAERDEARETNRNLNRRVQKFESDETSFRMSFGAWAKILFKTDHPPPERMADFASWQREIDKEFANGRALAAESRLARAEAALEVLDGIGLAMESRGYAHMTNGKSIGEIVDRLEELEAAALSLGEDKTDG